MPSPNSPMEDAEEEQKLQVAYLVSIGSVMIAGDEKDSPKNCEDDKENNEVGVNEDHEEHKNMEEKGDSKGDDGKEEEFICSQEARALGESLGDQRMGMTGKEHLIPFQNSPIPPPVQNSFLNSPPTPPLFQNSSPNPPLFPTLNTKQDSQKVPSADLSLSLSPVQNTN